MTKENVIIIGAGIGGLACGALLAQAGHKVLILEKNSYIGGACSSYKKNGYLFDRAVHVFSMGLNGQYGVVFKRLGLDYLQFREHVNEITAMKIHNQEGFVQYDTNVNTALKGLQASAKKKEEGGAGGSSDKGMMNSLKGLGFTKNTMKDLTTVMTNIMTMTKKKMRLMYEEGLTVTQWLNKYTEDPAIHGFIAFATAAMFCIGNGKASAAEFVHCFKSEMMTVEGMQYPLSGAAQAIPDAMGRGIKHYGGEIRTNTPVKSIVIKGNKVQGVMVGNELIEAPIVISNLSIKWSVLNLIGRDYFEKSYLNKIESLTPSLSSITFKLALKKPLVEHWGFVNCYHQTLHDFADKYPPEKGYPFSNGFFGPILSNLDQKTAPPGCQNAIFGTLVPSKGPDWKKWTDCYWEDLQSFFPNLEKNLDFVDISYPKDITASTGKPAGPVEGLALTPSQTGKNKPSSIIPGIEGLYVVGDTAGKNAHGIGTQEACQSGVMCADAILGNISFDKI